MSPTTISSAYGRVAAVWRLRLRASGSASTPRPSSSVATFGAPRSSLAMTTLASARTAAGERYSCPNTFNVLRRPEGHNLKWFDASKRLRYQFP